MKDKIIRKIMCLFFNFHCWTWKLAQHNGVCEPVTGKIPSRAVCKYCGLTMGIDLGK